VNPGTLQVAAEVFNDLTEWWSLSKAATNEIIDILTGTNIIQQFSEERDIFFSLTSLTITICESRIEILLSTPTPAHTKLLENMLLLLESHLSSRTFNFWVSFAEISTDIDEGHLGDSWLERALPILLQRAAWIDTDSDEWTAYRTDVVEVFEGICDVLGDNKLNSFVWGWLTNSLGPGDFDERMRVNELTAGLINVDS
jgi:hypothetical protein